jgi:rRNA-processing protein FCF1
MVLLDTNALFLPFRSKLPLPQEVERWRPGASIRVPSSVLGELDRLAARGVPRSSLARALAATFRPIEAPGRGDAAVVRVAVRTRAWVVTADRTLARRLVDAGVSVLVPRDRDRLELRRGRLREVARPLSSAREFPRRAPESGRG